MGWPGSSRGTFVTGVLSESHSLLGSGLGNDEMQPESLLVQQHLRKQKLVLGAAARGGYLFGLAPSEAWGAARALCFSVK